MNSLPLGEDRIDQVGENAGYYERATGEEVRAYFAQAAVAARRGPGRFASSPNTTHRARG